MVSPAHLSDQLLVTSLNSYGEAPHVYKVDCCNSVPQQGNLDYQHPMISIIIMVPNSREGKDMNDGCNLFTHKVTQHL